MQQRSRFFSFLMQQRSRSPPCFDVATFSSFLMQQRSRLSCFLMLATFSAVLMQQRSRFSQKTTETVVFDQTNDYSVDKLVRALNGLCDGALVVFLCRRQRLFSNSTRKEEERC